VVELWAEATSRGAMPGSMEWPRVAEKGGGATVLGVTEGER
jgi:hypothetical protein